jgi:OmcA/MtrC family decaheme c-type cytochrome
VVVTANCNNCHFNLQGHGARRNDAEYCVFCHNPSLTDASTRATSTNPADLAQPPQALNFALMVHKIHTGVNLAAMGATYVEVSHNGRHVDFGAAFASVPASIPNTGVRYPAMSLTGEVHDTTNCAMCHANTSEANFPIGKNQVTDPQGLLNPAPATTSACTACHLNTSAFAHAVSETDPKFGESCNVCHATGAPFDVDVVHAGQ